MAFAHPWLLWLLLLAPAIAYAGWCAATPRRTIVAVLRMTAIAALVVALAGPLVSVRSDARVVVNVIELSPAVSDDRARQIINALPPASAADRLVVFSSRAEVLADRNLLADPPQLTACRKRLAEKLWADDAALGGSNLAAALQLASAQIPPQTAGEVRLWTNGVNDHGDAAAETWRLAERGIAVRVNALAAADARAPVRITRFTVDGRARVGQTLRATVELESDVTGSAIVRVTPGNDAAISVALPVTPGMNRAAVSIPLKKPGITPIRCGLRIALMTPSWRSGRTRRRSSGA